MARVSANDAALTIAILAGGGGTRLGGVDKGLHLLDGRPLIEWVIEALLHPAREKLLIVANRNIDRYADYAPVIVDSGDGYRGPLAGIAAALAHCKTPWLCTLPVDCPYPAPDLLERLHDAALAQGAEAVVAHDGERRQPLFAVYRRELAGDALQALEEGLGVWKWQDTMGVFELVLPLSRRHWLNLNTPEDFVAFTENPHAGD